MNARRLVARSLRYHWRTHAPVLAGVALAAAILTGALITGDSVRGSLRDLALQRLGRVELALVTGEGFARHALADALEQRLGAPVAPVLYARASIVPERGGGPVAGVDLYGIDERFLALAAAAAAAAAAPAPVANGAAPTAIAPPAPGALLLGERLAERLEARSGEEMLLRFERPSALPRDVGLIPETARAASLRLRFREVLPDARLGRFSLRAEQQAPLAAFCARTDLARALERPERANLFLVGPDGRGGPSPVAARAALRAAWRPEDAGLRVEAVRGLPVVQVSTERIFLDPAVADAAPTLGEGARPLLTYFVSEIRRGERAVPYAFVCGRDGGLGGATAAGGAPDALRSDEIAINAWLARELEAAPGDAVVLRFLTIGPERRLIEAERTFRVAAVVPIEAGDPGLAPPLPGLHGKAHCREWDPGLPVDLSRLRPADEAYWERYAGTPKAFVGLAAAREMWSNRFGDATALRAPIPSLASEAPLAPRADGAPDPATAGSAAAAVAALSEALRREVDPEALGLAIDDVRAEALAAADPTVDFGQLFLGLSFFLIGSALLLTAMLFRFGVEQRLAEVGLLRAVGFGPARVRRLALAEGACVAAVGVALGAVLGVAYAHLVVGGLRGAWIDAVGTRALAVHVEPASVAVGAAAALFAALGSMALGLRRALAASPRALLAGGRELDLVRAASTARGGSRWGRGGVAVAFALAIALAAVGLGRAHAAGLFFGAGGLVLVASVGACHLGLARLARAARSRRLTTFGIALRANARDAGRRLVTIAVLATGVFLVAAVGANRAGPGPDATARAAGTGGFALLVESTRPIVHDLGDPIGREEALATDEPLADAGFVAFRVGRGDDASCLNLHRVPEPRLLGVRPEVLAERGAFGFASVRRGAPPGSPWRLLDEPASDPQAIPAIADASTAIWSLRTGLGGHLAYTDERGRPFRVEIVALLEPSILQGSLVISEARFQERFPTVEGHRLLLVDAPLERAGAVSASLRRGLRDFGVEVTRTAERLAEYQAVERTYLRIFLALGGLALALGTVGLAVVVGRAILERRGELALLGAVGFTPSRLRRMLLVEHGALVLAGVGCGSVAALVAALPALRGGGGAPQGLAAAGPLAATGLWVLVIFAVGLVSVGLAASLGLRAAAPAPGALGGD